MRLALNLGYWGSDQGSPDTDRDLAEEAERLGFASIWVAEAYGSDAVSRLAWLAAHTTSIRLGSAVLQIPGRTPAMTAMTAATLQTISAGRFSLGLGVSGPQVSEGWHGVRFNQPLQRTRAYVEIVQSALRREVVRHEGPWFELPLPDGPGKALRLAITPLADTPIYLAAMGPKNLELTGELADGWLAMFFSPSLSDASLASIAKGRAQGGKSLDGFDVMPTVPVALGDDMEACADLIRDYVALYVGGMGSKKQNFYHDLVSRLGFAAAADEVQQRYLVRDYQGAAKAVPLELIDQTSLIGPEQRVADRMKDFAASGVTTLSVALHARSHDVRRQTLSVLAHALDKSGVGGGP